MCYYLCVLDYSIVGHFPKEPSVVATIDDIKGRKLVVQVNLKEKIKGNYQHDFKLVEENCNEEMTDAFVVNLPKIEDWVYNSVENIYYITYPSPDKGVKMYKWFLSSDLENVYKYLAIDLGYHSKEEVLFRYANPNMSLYLVKDSNMELIESYTDFKFDNKHRMSIAKAIANNYEKYIDSEISEKQNICSLEYQLYRDVNDWVYDSITTQYFLFYKVPNDEQRLVLFVLKSNR